MSDFYSIPPNKVRKAVKAISNSMQNTGSFKAFNEEELSVYKAIIDDIFLFQYSPDKTLLLEFIKNYGTESERKKEFCKLFDNYQFIPIKTIMEFASSKCESPIAYSVDYKWFKLDKKIRNEISLDISKASGTSIISLINTLALFFGSINVKVKQLISDYDSTENGMVDPDLDYWATILINPSNFNSLGFVYDEITEVKNLVDDTSDVNEVLETISSFVNDVYIPWATKAQNELYNWFMLLQTGFITADLEDNKNLRENQTTYEINIREKDSKEKIDFSSFIIKTFPSASIDIKRRGNKVKLTISQNENKVYEILKNFVFLAEEANI